MKIVLYRLLIIPINKIVDRLLNCNKSHNLSTADIVTPALDRNNELDPASATAVGIALVSVPSLTSVDVRCALLRT